MTFDETSAALNALWDEVPADLIFLRRVDSTNRLATRVARELERDQIEIHPTLFLAWEQTGGLGRRGRTWESPAGLGIYATLLLPLPDPERARLLPMAAAVALGGRLDRWCNQGCRLKWPNDLLVEGRKIGGILVSSTGGPEGPGHAAVGFGVNHGHREDELPSAAATSLHLAASPPPPYADAVAGLVRDLATRLTRAPEQPALVEGFRRLSLHKAGDHLVCDAGGEVVEGAFLGFADDGALRLATADGERTLHAGDLE